MKCQKKKFLLNKKYAFLNCAYMSPMMKKVENAGRRGIAKKRQPNLIGMDDFFGTQETIKSLFGKLVNADDPDRITLIPSVSYGLANVAHNLKIQEGENIVACGQQFPSNIYPWMDICGKNKAELILVEPPNTIENRGKQWNDDILDHVNDKTKAVCMGHVHWADGTLFDLVAIRKKCDQVGALLIIDGTQSIGALPFDIQEIKPDALIVAGYKFMMGPYSTGLAYFGKYFDEGKPIEQNWINRMGSENFAELVNYQDQYQHGAARYGVGERSNFILNPMLIAALKQLLLWKPENIQQYCHELIEPLVTEVNRLGFYIEEQEHRAAHLFGIKIPEEKKEAIEKMLKTHKVSVSFRGSFIRVSPHVYNDDRDIKKLIRAFQAI